MRKTLRIFFWMIKGVLMVIALAALVMWPVSRGREVWLGGRKTLTGPGRYIINWQRADCFDGWLAVYDFSFPDWSFDTKERVSTEWHWDAWAKEASWNEDHWSRIGPCRWFRSQQKHPDWGITAVWRGFAAPLWLVALVTATWPAASLSLLVRRGLRRRRFRGRGLCERCGYDLRATPRPAADGGEVLTVCPECGHASSAKR